MKQEVLGLQVAMDPSTLVHLLQDLQEVAGHAVHLHRATGAILQTRAVLEVQGQSFDAQIFEEEGLAIQPGGGEKH